MKRSTKPIWIALILSLFVHFFLIGYLNNLLEASSNKQEMERTYTTSITLKLEAAPSPAIKNLRAPKIESIPDFQNIEKHPTEKEILYEEEKIFSKMLSVEEIIQTTIDKKELYHPSVIEKTEVQEETIKDFPKKSSTERITKKEKPQSPADTKEKIHQIKEKPGKELLSNKMISTEKVKAETEKSLATGNKETEKEVEQEKERNFPSQSKNNEYLKEKTVQEKPNIAFQETDGINEDQGEKNLEIEEALDFTGNNYQDNANPPELLEFQRPVYPKNLRERDIEGKVTLKVLIDKDGKVKETQIFESSGYESFNQVAINSVRQWQFKPAKKGNQTRESWILIPIHFQIK